MTAKTFRYSFKGPRVCQVGMTDEENSSSVCFHLYTRQIGAKVIRPTNLFPFLFSRYRRRFPKITGGVDHMRRDTQAREI